MKIITSLMLSIFLYCNAIQASAIQYFSKEQFCNHILGDFKCNFHEEKIMEALSKLDEKKLSCEFLFFIRPFISGAEFDINIFDYPKMIIMLSDIEARDYTLFTHSVYSLIQGPLGVQNHGKDAYGRLTSFVLPKSYTVNIIESLVKTSSTHYNSFVSVIFTLPFQNCYNYLRNINELPAVPKELLTPEFVKTAKRCVEGLDPYHMCTFLSKISALVENGHTIDTFYEATGEWRASLSLKH